MGGGPLGPIGVFHAEIQVDVCVPDPIGPEGPAPILDDEPWPRPGTPSAHCAVCHWMHSLRAFASAPVVIVSIERVAERVPAAVFAPATPSPTTRPTPRAPPAPAA